MERVARLSLGLHFQFGLPNHQRFPFRKEINEQLLPAFVHQVQVYLGLPSRLNIFQINLVSGDFKNILVQIPTEELLVNLILLNLKEVANLVGHFPNEHIFKNGVVLLDADQVVVGLLWQQEALGDDKLNVFGNLEEVNAGAKQVQNLELVVLGKYENSLVVIQNLGGLEGDFHFLFAELL